MRKLLLLTFMLIAFQAEAQQSLWKIPITKDIVYAANSADGKYQLYAYEDKMYTIVCLDGASGRELWRKKVVDGPALEALRSYRLWKVIDNQVFLMSDKGRHVFVKLADGTELASIPIPGGEWEDLLTNNSAQTGKRSVPEFGDGWAFYPFSGGSHYVALTTRSEFYKTTMRQSLEPVEEMDGIRMHVMSDSVVFIDVAQKKVVFEQPTILNSTMYSHFFAHKNQMLVFNEDNIASVDLTRGAVDALIPVDPDDPDYFAPYIDASGMSLLVGQDDEQKMYNLKTGQVRWTIAKGGIPGFIDAAYPTKDGGIILFYYSTNDICGVARISADKGTVLWKRDLVEQDGEYQPGHRRKGGIGALQIVSLVASVIATSASRGAAMSSGGGMYNVYSFDFTGALHRDRSSGAYFKTLEMNDNSITFLIAGKYEPVEGSGLKQDDPNNEHILTLDLLTGKTVNAMPCDVVSAFEMKNYNAYAAIENNRLEYMEKGTLIVGVKALYVVTGQNVKAVTFGQGAPELRSVKDDLVYISTRDRDNVQLRYWQLRPFSTSIERTLLARSRPPLLTGSTFESFTSCLDITEDGISSLALASGNPSEAYFAKPVWTKNFEELGVGSIKMADNNEFVSPYPIAGVCVQQGRILLMGRDGIAMLNADGSCSWKKEWDTSPSKTRLGVVLQDKTIAFATGDDLRCIKADCTGTEFVKREAGFDETAVSIQGSAHCIMFYVNSQYIECVKTD